MKKAFFHSVDLDGHCSGAIFQRVAKLQGWEDVQLIGYNYGDTIDVQALFGCDVFFLDCTPSPIATLLPEILEAAASVTICDHHRTALKDLEPFAGKFEGNSQEGKAGCLLTWEWFEKVLGCEVPYAVRLLSTYDCWQNQNVEQWEKFVLPFQYGMKAKITNPTKAESSKVWDAVLTDALPMYATQVNTIIHTGKILMDAERKRLASLAKANCFEATVLGKRAICMNSCTRNSQAFDAVWNPEKHDIMCVFLLQPNKEKTALEWSVSLYSTKPEINCGELAKTKGGGGHPGAAGFRIHRLSLRDGELVFSDETKGQSL